MKEKFINSLYFQFFIIIFTIISFIVIIQIQLTKFTARDFKPQITPFYLKKGSTFYQTQATAVNTGLFVKDFPTFDIQNNKFVMDGTLWFEFDPHAVSIDTIENFVFEKGTILYKSPTPQTKLIEGKIFARYTIRVQFESNLDFQYFPLEDHFVYLSLTNRSVSPSEVIFTSYKSNLVFPKEIYIHNWNYVDHSVDYGYTTFTLQQKDMQKISANPSILFTFNFRKSGIKKVILIFIPILICYFLSLLSLIVKSRQYGLALSLSIGSISSGVFIYSGVQYSAPNTGYFTISDIIYTILFIALFIVLLTNFFATKYILKKEDELKDNKTLLEKTYEKMDFLRSYMFLFISIINIFNITLLFYLK